MKLLLDERDMKFVLFEQLKVDRLCERPLYAEHSQELFEMSLDEAGKLAEKEFYPANAAGDREGCRFEDGRVFVPESFHRPWNLYREGGWLAMADEPEVGGQGFPSVISAACVETFGAGNWSLLMYAGLTHGAARLLQKHGPAELRSLYLTRMYSGEWTGTMCLTEPQAGTDLGDLRTKAVRRPDGAYHITGRKTFISSGMHDLSENIIHMVLARTEGAPKGTRGISVFLVPRLRFGLDGALEDNDVACTGIERKLGIHGSATCSLNFGERGDCVGHLLGRENEGMRIMFDMMNEARFFVGIQGLSLGDAAYMHALRYAKERVQGAPVEKMRDPEAERVPIIRHPDVRRMLMTMKSSTEGMRSLVYLAGYCLDIVRAARDEQERELFQGYLDLLIPLCKSVCTDVGFRVCETAIQVHGGYGYCRDYPVEQFLRDCKIASIYEGTNGIQALDLVGRKLTFKNGQLLKNALLAIEEILGKIRKNFRLRDLVRIYEEAQENAVQVARFFALKGMTDEFHVPILYAKPYLDLCGDVGMGFLLLWQAHIADRKFQEICRDHRVQDEEGRERLLRENRSAAFYFGKICSARFFVNHVLTQAGGKARAIMNSDKSALEIPDYGFALQ
ncbi:MAG: acyl-CoA dehydrogenase [Desulfobacteraceae bacterium]|nr:acyl-CoA dehydrogenase [Desulfobacteraceae bacterium]